MKKSTRNALIGTGIAAATITAVGAAAYTVSKQLLEFALDREAPKMLQKGKEKLSGYDEEYDRLMAEVDVAAQKLERCGCTEVEITGHDGIKLVGHWYENPNARRIVVAMHGWRSSWSQDFGMIADFMHENGCSVLYAEQRGQNSSGGNYMTFGLLERLCQRKIRMGAKEYSTIDAMNGCQIPVLFIHGADDRFVPVTMTYENYRACTAPKQLLIVPGAQHGLSYYVEQDKYEKAVKEFWKSSDICSSSSAG